MWGRNQIHLPEKFENALIPNAVSVANAKRDEREERHPGVETIMLQCLNVQKSPISQLVLITDIFNYKTVQFGECRPIIH